VDVAAKPYGDASAKAENEEYNEEVEELPTEGDSLTVKGVVHDAAVEEIERGKITRERLYRIRYSDGDLQHFTAKEPVSYWTHIFQKNCGSHETASTLRCRRRMRNVVVTHYCAAIFHAFCSCAVWR